MSKVINHTKFLFISSEASQEVGDVLFNWTTTDLKAGDEVFYKLHKEAGSIVFNECQRGLQLHGVKVGSSYTLPLTKCIITNSGALLVKKILHIPLPNYRNKEEKAIKSKILIEILNQCFIYLDVYSKDKQPIRKIIIPNIPSKLYGVVSPLDIQNFISIIIEQSLKLNLRETKIIVSPELLSQYENEFIKQTNKTHSFLDKLWLKIFS